MSLASQAVFRLLIDADANGAIREFDRFNKATQGSASAANKQASKMSAAFGKMKVAAAAVGAAAVVSLGKMAVNASKDLTESINAVEVSYGSAGDAVLRMSEDASRSAGLSQRAFNEAAVAVQAFVQEIASGTGRGMAEVLDELITRAADFGSVFNIDVDEALQRFRSGLAGETEPLRKFGINLLQSEVNAYAFANGIAEVGSELTEQEKVTARYGLLLEKTDKFQGDFANTSGELANRQRILRAETENLAAEVGDALVPAALAATEAMLSFVGFLNDIKVPQALKIIAETLATIGGNEIDPGPTQTFVDTWENADFKTNIDNIGRIANEIGESDGAWTTFKKNLIEGVTFSDDFRDAENFGRAFDDILGQSRTMAIGITNDMEALLAAAAAGDEQAQKWAKDWGITTERVAEFRAQIGALRPKFSGAQNQLDDYTYSIDELARQGRAAFQGIGVDATETGRRINAEYTAMYAGVTRASATHRAAVAALQNKYEDLLGLIDDESAWLSLEDSFDRVEDAMVATVEAQDEFGTGSEAAKRAANDQAQAVNDLRRDVAEYATEVLELPAEQVTEIVANLNESNIDEIERQLAVLARDREMVIRARQTSSNFSPQSSYTDPNTGRTKYFGAEGAIVNRPTLAMIGEAGPEAVVPLHRSPGNAPLPSGSSPDGSSTVFNVNVNAGIGTDGAQVGRQVVDAIKSFERTNGTRWRAA